LARTMNSANRMKNERRPQAPGHVPSKQLRDMLVERLTVKWTGQLAQRRCRGLWRSGDGRAAGLAQVAGGGADRRRAAGGGFDTGGAV
jgi:hypothetical protein